MNKYLIEDDMYRSFKKNKLIKVNNYNDSTIIISDNLVEDINEENIKLLSEKIKNFLIVLDKNCPNFNPNLFIKNYKKTIFRIKHDDNSVDKNILGRVLMLNPIRFYIRTFDVVNHELLHLSSIRKDIYDELFWAYDEAYTQLLAERYFNEKANGTFDLVVSIMKSIETIVGKDLMETKFFEGKLYSTIKELYKYESKEKINFMLLNLKKIYLLRGKSNAENEIQNYLNQIFPILISCLKQKKEKIICFKEIINIVEPEKLIDICLYKSNILSENVIEELNQELNILEQKKKIINR